MRLRSLNEALTHGYNYLFQADVLIVSPRNMIEREFLDPLDRECSLDLWACSPVIDERTFHQVRTRLALDHAKWDPRIGDSETLGGSP